MFDYIRQDSETNAALMVEKIFSAGQIAEFPTPPEF